MFLNSNVFKLFKLDSSLKAFKKIWEILKLL